jgi:hypothetical protein
LKQILDNVLKEVKMKPFELSTFKVIAGSAFTLAAGYIWYCPCDSLVSCHKKPFFLSLGIGLVVVLFFSEQNKWL